MTTTRSVRTAARSLPTSSTNTSRRRPVYVDIDLCCSSYDTKVYVYDAGLNLIACNDDFYFGAPCGVYVSKLENIPFAAGGTYYIIIDGYGEASGAYVLDITGFVPCVVTCPAGGYPEGEPPLVPNTSTTTTAAATPAPATRSRLCPSWQSRPSSAASAVGTRSRAASTVTPTGTS